MLFLFNITALHWHNFLCNAHYGFAEFRKIVFFFYSVIYLLLLPALDFYCATECVTD